MSLDEFCETMALSPVARRRAGGRVPIGTATGCGTITPLANA